MLAERVGINIRKAREARGWSLERLAEKVKPKTTYGQISRLESGKRGLTLDWVERIANALQMDPVQLLDESAAPVQFTLDESVANELARQLAVLVLEGEAPEPGIVQVLSLALQELTRTFSKHPQAYHDPNVARPVIDLVTLRHAPLAS